MSGNPFNVLLIESDENEAALVKRRLAGSEGSDERFEVKEAVRVSSACHCLAKESFDAAILDLTLPRTSGLEGYARIRAQRPDLPIVLLAGLKDEALAKQAIRLGAQDYLVKGTLESCMLKRAILHAIEKKKLDVLVRHLLDKDASAKLVVDESAVVLYANPAAESLFGLPAAELTGKPFAYPRDPGAVTIVSPQAAERAAEMSVSGVDWNGGPGRLISFRSDAVAAGDPDASEKARLDDIKTQFSRRLSHEMRNTLSTVKTAVFCLRDAATGPLSPRQERLVDMVSRNVDRQVRIFDKLGDLSRFESGRLKFTLQPIDMRGLLAEFARDSELKGTPRRLEVELRGDLPSIEGDADLLLQALRGLLDNAYRHAKDKVTLTATSDDSELRVVVADDGGGIPKERLAGLFTPFDQLDRRKGAEGFKGGLGLTMAREIVAGHHGRIWAESDAKGSRFFIALPLHFKPDEARAQKIYVSNSHTRPTYAAAEARERA